MSKAQVIEMSVTRKGGDGVNGGGGGDPDSDDGERGNWGGKMDFLLSAIGFAVGLGNVWRFPYKAYQNGGGSFLIPYTIMLAFAGLPLFFLEMGVGQFSSLGPISVWRAVPLFKGLGWTMVFVSALVSIQYNMIIAYTIYYIFASFTSTLPWSSCQPDWITEFGCKERVNQTEGARNLTAAICASMRTENKTDSSEYISNCTTATPSEIYWERVVLKMSDGIDVGTDEFSWQLVLCLLLAWLIVFLCLSRGIKSSGKVVYVTATLPYVVLLILLIHNLTLDGAGQGIHFYVTPDFRKLGDVKVWFAAAEQIFYSLGVAWGGLETMASYNKFHNNIYRDALIVAILNCATSVFAGFVIFAVLGFMAERAGVAVGDVASSGPGLAFIAYPEGLTQMSVAPLWSVLFFVMLFTLGLDSQFAMLETVISALVDEFAALQTGRRRTYLTMAICVSFFLIGLPQCTAAGIYVVELFNWYSAALSLMVVATLEGVVWSWIYGYKRICNDFEMMLGFKPNYYWLATWMFITPVLMTFILVVTLLNFSVATYKRTYITYVYPTFAHNIGIAFVVVGLSFVPVVALIELYKKKSLRKAVQPEEDWGPALARDRTGIYAEGLTFGDGKTNIAFDPEFL